MHPPPSPADTKTTILDAAERLFAERGIAATSLRAITGAAKVNLAAVNYHFGSKDALVGAVFSRRLDPLNEERIARLEALEAESGDEPLDLESLLRAFVAPVIELGLAPGIGDTLRQLFGRLYTEPSDVVRQIIVEQFQDVARRFIAAFRAALPNIDAEEVFWRVHFAVGTMAQTCCDTQRLTMISSGTCDPSDVKGTTDRLVSFLVGGMRA